MDLVAYAQIDNLGSIAKKNNIIVPRLRGYRLMKNEEVLTEEDIKEHARQVGVSECEDYIRSHGRGWFYQFNKSTNDLVAKYIKGKTEDINWDAVHGKLRKQFKFLMKKTYKRYKKQYDTFNKYVGRDDVLYIHARIGGSNWYYYGGNELEKQPWFIERVDDSYDNTYCDIYARIEPVKGDVCDGLG
ncbi:MAG: hypothetical protein J6S14_12020 [Clostridia bacterium]|nr:hypothetical protein [Clostridia bacterium]